MLGGPFRGGTTVSTLKLTSPAFDPFQKIPVKYTCEGADVSPPLSWSGVPDGTQSLALIVDDPDAPDPQAPMRVWVHWVLYNLPASATELREDASPGDLPEGTCIGKNDWRLAEYVGPCPPVGRHRYFHKLYALDTELPERDALNKAELTDAMKGHILAEADLVGTYEKALGRHEGG
jgi:Raf kinase inhibitor-like YbhB/YbcL family protein